MDRLDQLLATAAPLLGRIDEVLARAGAHPDHPVWSEMRRVRLLPGDAARAVAALRPAVLLDAAPELRADARVCAEVADALPAPGAWSGTAAEAYEQTRRRFAEELTGESDSLRARLSATADLGDAMARWMGRAREELAATLAAVLGSAAAVTLTTAADFDLPTRAEAAAAAEAATAVLRVVASSYDHAEELLRDAAPG